ncbi:MAG TPA: serine hydrolase [Nostocaceae cyanobacterium]|nr:serine hydrolase [Nostocaceae cyanobacterium]
MNFYLSNRRKFIQFLGITSALAVLGDWTLNQESASATEASAWVARHGLTSDEYQNIFNKYVTQGYRPVQVSGYVVGNQDRYAAIFEKISNSPAWIAHHRMTSDEYQNRFNNYVAQGYRPIQVSGYAIGSQDYYAAIFEKTSNPPAWIARHRITSNEYQNIFNNYVAQGYRLVDVSAYTIGSEDYYTAIFEKTPNPPAWIARHRMTSNEYQTEFNKYISQGYRLVKVSGYSLNSQDRYAAIWEKSSSGIWAARHGMNSQEYQDEFDRYFYQGYRPIWVNGYTVNGQDKYAAIWQSKNAYQLSELQAIEKVVAQFMQDYSVPGISFAIAKDGRLVLAGTYGYADTSTLEKVAPRHRFRIASCSKPITAIAIMKLVEQGKLKLSDTVFGADGILGTQYGTLPYKKMSIKLQ